MILTEVAHMGHKIVYGVISVAMLVGFALLLHHAMKESKRRAARRKKLASIQHKLAKTCQHQKRKDHARNFGHYEG